MIRKRPQVQIEIQHSLHAGVYTRTARIPAGVVIVGAEIVIPTTLIIAGDCETWIDGVPHRVKGYATLLAQAHRKSVFYAHANTFITMIFKTDAKTVEEAENEFTNEPEKLQTRGQSCRV